MVAKKAKRRPSGSQAIVGSRPCSLELCKADSCVAIEAQGGLRRMAWISLGCHRGRFYAAGNISPYADENAEAARCVCAEPCWLKPESLNYLRLEWPFHRQCIVLALRTCSQCYHFLLYKVSRLSIQWTGLPWLPTVPGTPIFHFFHVKKRVMSIKPWLKEDASGHGKPGSSKCGVPPPP